MTEQAWDSPMAAPRPKARGWLKGRGNRKEYWMAMGALIGIGAILGMLGLSIGSATGVPSMLFMIRRFHDIGKSGWWALAITFGPVVPMLVLMPFAPMPVLLGLVVLLSLVWTIWLGSIPGEAHENRWGPPPGRPDLEEVFS